MELATQYLSQVVTAEDHSVFGLRYDAHCAVSRAGSALLVVEALGEREMGYVSVQQVVHRRGLNQAVTPVVLDVVAASALVARSGISGQVSLVPSLVAW
jgi:hypothetical protein